MRLIGLDCATQDARVGVAVGDYRAGTLTVASVEVCSGGQTADAVLRRHLEGVDDALLAVDAPLGWPMDLAMELAHHKAGRRVKSEPDRMFRRETDRFIKAQTGKTPLDVGADRIARTAHAALRLLDKVRDITGHALDLAWSPNLLHGVSAIEVYPAATLTAHRFRASGYKKPADTKKRQEIVTKLADELTFAPDVTLAMLQNADALDAVVCLLAAKDFLEGRAMGPIDGRLASQEGWIWCARA